HQTAQECQVDDFQRRYDGAPGGRRDGGDGGDRHDLAARALAGGDPGRGVLDDRAPGRVGPEALGGGQIRVRVRLGARDLVTGDREAEVPPSEGVHDAVDDPPVRGG